MGMDKAALRWNDSTLLDHVAAVVADAAGSVTVVGRHSPKWPSLADLLPESGPIGGIAAALQSGGAEWSLIVACDMPAVDAVWLRALLDRSAGDVVVPRTADGRVHPLCAVWHRRAAAPVVEAAHAGRRRVRDLLADLRTHYVDLPGAEWHLKNLNTPEDLAQWQTAVVR